MATPQTGGQFMEGAALLFERIFDKPPEICCFAPGRVNLIGEHTDYNGGHVFPCAIDKGIYCAARKRSDRKFLFYSVNLPDEGIIEYAADNIPLKGCWADYPVSVIRALSAFGHDIRGGAEMLFCGDLPEGAGLSSSAALEVVTAVALREMFSLPLTGQETAVIGQFAENRFIGVSCGIMDQFASAMGRENNAILLDSNTLEYEYAPVGKAGIVIINSGVKHSLAGSEYNQRRRECEHAAGMLGVTSLCSLTPDEFEKSKHLINDDICLRRAHHAVYENQRAIDAVSALNRNDLAEFGRLMNLSHISLRDHYEVSCEQLDHLAQAAQNYPGVYGARMTGGGFGGCTVNLVSPEAVNDFIDFIQSDYENSFGIKPEIYRVKAVSGARRLLP